MAKNKNEFIVDIKANVKDLKDDVRRELKKVLDETKHVSNQIEEGLAPDTSEFEHRLQSLEKSVEDLGQNCSSTKELVSSMKTAFADFVKIQGEMNGKTQQMLDLFEKMTPKTKELFDAFITTHADDAMDVLAKATKNVGASAGEAASGVQQMQKVAKQAADDASKSVHKVQVAADATYNAVENTISATTNSITEARKRVNELTNALDDLKRRRENYTYNWTRKTDIKSNEGQDYLLKDIEEKHKEFEIVEQDIIRAKEGTDEWYESIRKLIKIGYQMSGMTALVIDDKKLKDMPWLKEAEDAVDNYIYEYEDELNSFVQKFGQKVKLKPLEIEIDISDDDKLISKINNAIDRIRENSKIKPLEIPLDFIDSGDETTKKKNKKKKTKNVKITNAEGTQEEVEVDSRLGSVAQEIENLQKNFNKIKEPLLNNIKEWHDNLEQYLTLQFKWGKVGQQSEFNNLFDDLNKEAEKRPIWLSPDTDKLISEIETALTQHKFNLNLSGSSLNVSGNLNGSTPLFFVGGTGSHQASAPQGTIRQSGNVPKSTIKTETKKETTSVDANSKAVEKNSDVIRDVINEFKEYSQKGNNAIDKATKEIEQLTKQNEKLDKNKPEDAEKIIENNRQIGAKTRKIELQQERFDAIRARTGINVQNIANINDDELYKLISDLVNDRNEIVDVLSRTKIGGATNSKTFLTKSIQNLINSIKTAQEALNIEVKDAETVDMELAAKQYLEDVEQLAHMGKALKQVNREIRNNAMPTQDSLEQVSDVFIERGLTHIAQGAEDLRYALSQYDDVFGEIGYQGYTNQLNDEILQIQSDIDKLKKHPRKNKTEIAEKKAQLTEKQAELDGIRNEIEPVLNKFKQSIKGMPGQIASMLKGYKFIVEFIDEDGNKVVESFNDKSSRAPKDTEAYYKQTVNLTDRINAGSKNEKFDNIVSITPKSTPNDQAISMFYDDKISKAAAVQNVINAYGNLDDQARAFVDTLIDINRLTDDNISASEKLEDILNSSLISWSENGAGRSSYANAKFKKNQTMDDFLNTVIESYFGVNAVGKLKDRTQIMLGSGVPVSFGVQKHAEVPHPEEYKYEYSAADRSYRTEFDKQKLLDIESENYKQSKQNVENLSSVVEERNKVLNTELDNYTGVFKEIEDVVVDTSMSKDLQKQAEQNGGIQAYYKAVQDSNAMLLAEANKLQEEIGNVKTQQFDQNALSQKQEQAQRTLQKYQTIKAGVQQYGYDQYKKMLEKEGNASMLSGWSAYDFEFRENESFEKIIGGSLSLEDYLKSVTKREDAAYDQLIAERNANNQKIQEQQNKINENVAKIKTLDQDKDLDTIRVLSQENSNLHENIQQITQRNRELDYEIKQNRTRADNLTKDQTALYKDYASRHKDKKTNIDVAIDQLIKDEGIDANSIVSSLEQESQQKQAKLKELEQKIEQNNAILDKIKLVYGSEHDIALMTEIDDLKGKNQTDTISTTLNEKLSELYRSQITRLEGLLQKDIDELKTKEQTGEVTTEIANKESLLQKLKVAKQSLQDAGELYREASKQLSEAQQSMERSDVNIKSLTSSIDSNSSTVGIEQGSQQAKIYALREIEKIDSDLELADKKIAAAEKKKQDLDVRIKTLQKKKENASEVIDSQKQATGYATETAKGTSEYKDFQKELHNQFASGAITWDEYSEKIQAKIDEIVARLKEAEPDKYTGKSHEELEALLNKEKQLYQYDIDAAEAKKKELQSQKQAAIEFAKLSDEELTTQRAITEEKKEQVATTQQEANIQTQQNAEAHVEKQSAQVDSARIQELNNRITAIDNELNKLNTEVKSTPKQKKSTTKTKKLTEKQQAKADKQFLGYVSQIKAKELSKGINMKDVDLSEAINMQKQLNTLTEQGNQNTEEYLILQRKLSELIREKTWKLKGSGREGYATNDEKYEWLKSNVSEDVANFFKSDQYVMQAPKFDAAVAQKLGQSLVEGYTAEFRAECANKAKEAYDKAISDGKAKKDAKKAAVRVVNGLIDNYKKGITEGAKEELQEEASSTVNNKARIEELKKQKAQLVAERDNLIAQGSNVSSGTSSYPTQLDFGGFAIQADKVVVNGNAVGTSGDGSGPWALETTLGRTNEILNSINSKIDSVKGGSNSDDDSPIGSGARKKKSKKEDVDVEGIKSLLYAEADKDLSESFGEGTKSVRKFDERTLKLYQTLTLANGEVVKLTYSMDKMGEQVQSSYTTIANFESVAKKAYAELGANKISTNNLFGNENFNFPADKVNAYNQALTALETKLKSLGQKGVTTPESAEEVKTLTNNVKNLRTEIENMVKASDKNRSKGDLIKVLNKDEIDDVKASMRRLAEETYDTVVSESNFNDTTNEMTFTVRTGKNELKTITYQFDELTHAVTKTGDTTKTTTGFFRSFFSGVGAKIGELARYYTGMSLLTEAIQRVRQGVQYVREIDLALTELKKVTDESESSYHRFLQTMSNTAGVVGSTVSELTNSAAAWSRLGYSIEEAGILAKNTAILLNVSEFESEEQATEALISSLQAFNYTAEDSIKIVDKLNIVGKYVAQVI